jgi:hypothetical protein
MKEFDYTTLPHNLVDFGNALKMLANSQSDVTELVVKWDELIDTKTPKTVTIKLSDGTVHKIDNLAKIRNDLIAGLSLDEPRVKGITFYSPYVHGGIRADSFFGQVYGGEVTNDASGIYMSNPDADGMQGMRYGVHNVLRTCAMTQKTSGRLEMDDLPDVLFLGATWITNSSAPDNFTLTLVSPRAAYVQRNEMTGSVQYCGRTTLINQSNAPFTFKVLDATGAVKYNRVIPAYGCVSCVFWAACGQDTVNFREINWVQSGVINDG